FDIANLEGPNFTHKKATRDFTSCGLWHAHRARGSRARRPCHTTNSQPAVGFVPKLARPGAARLVAGAPVRPTNARRRARPSLKDLRAQSLSSADRFPDARPNHKAAHRLRSKSIQSNKCLR